MSFLTVNLQTSDIMNNLKVFSVIFFLGCKIVSASEDFASGSISGKIYIGSGVLAVADRIVIGDLTKGAALIEGKELIDLKRLLRGCLSEEWEADKINNKEGIFNRITVNVFIKSKMDNKYIKVITFPMAKSIIEDQKEYDSLVSWINLLPDDVWGK